MTTDITGIVGLYFAINLHKNTRKKCKIEASEMKMDDHIVVGEIVTCLMTNKPTQTNLAALPEEVKHIITEAFTLMAARTYIVRKI